MNTKLIGVKLTKTEAKGLDDLIQFGGFKSRSHVLRQLLFDELERRGLKLEGRVAIKLERLRSPMRRRRHVDASK